MDTGFVHETFREGGKLRFHKESSTGSKNRVHNFIVAYFPSRLEDKRGTQNTAAPEGLPNVGRSVFLSSNSILSAIQCEPHLHCHLPVRNLAILEVAAYLGDFKPPHIADCFASSTDRVVHCIFDAVWRGTDQFDLFVDVVTHPRIKPFQVASSEYIPRSRERDKNNQVATTRPPTARMTSPVIQADSSDARNTASGAISVTRPSRPSGVFPARTAPAPSSKVPAVIFPSVSV